MLKEWQFNVLFFVGVGGAIFLLLAPEFGLNASQNPTALAGVGSILTYILTQKKSLVKRDPSKQGRHQKKDSNVEEPDNPKEDE